MNDRPDMDEPRETTPVPTSRLSKTPSWISLGFILGVLFVLALHTGEDVVNQAKAPVAPPLPVKLERPKLTEIEAVFADYGHHAIWHNDLTEVALWDTTKHSYTQYYEVMRSGGIFYFRAIDKLTRPVITAGMPRDCPLLFTQPENPDPEPR